MTYNLGDVVSVTIVFAVSGTPTAPTTWFLRITTPTGGTTSVLSSDATISGAAGSYTWTLPTEWNDTAAIGTWTVRAVSTTGATQSSGSTTFEVRA